jgi:hypothetical protein
VNRISNRTRIKRPAARAARPAKLDHQNLLAATIEDARRLPSFALILEGNALAPDFMDGDLLTVATDALALPGDCVVALVGSTYRCMRLNADGDLWDGKGGFVPRGFYSLVGVVLDRTPREQA